MMSTHKFVLDLAWKYQEIENSGPTAKTIKNHTIKIIGKEDLRISAAKTFKGDPSLHNPEDMLLASLTSCHMMSYLYCCSKRNIQVISYHDKSEAILEVSADGSGRIIKVTLNPVVEIGEASQIEMAHSLHQEANKLCFIANSCNFPIEHNAEVIAINGSY